MCCLYGSSRLIFPRINAFIVFIFDRIFCYISAISFILLTAFKAVFWGNPVHENSLSPFHKSPHGRPMDLFLKISLLQAIVCSLGDVEKVICPWKESVAGKKTIQGV